MDWKYGLKFDYVSLLPITKAEYKRAKRQREEEEAEEKRLEEEKKRQAEEDAKRQEEAESEPQKGAENTTEEKGEDTAMQIEGEANIAVSLVEIKKMEEKEHLDEDMYPEPEPEMDTHLIAEDDGE